MTTDSKPRIKITYATLSADNEELHAGFEAALGGGARQARRPPPATTSTARGGMATAPSRPAHRSTATSSSARSRRGTAADVDDAVAAARAAQPAWAARPWRDRLAIVKRAGDLISER